MNSKRKVKNNILEERGRNEIFIKGARSNNLKNVDIAIPRNKLVVVTGVSGSGKSSITMDTLYAEGQRRYVESLSSYARQFLMRMKKPDVDYIRGLCPAIAIEQHAGTRNARSTVGTLTEIYDYLRLLFARVGKTISPISGEAVKKHQVSDVVDYVQQLPEGTKVLLIIPLRKKYDRTVQMELGLLLQKGYTRLMVDDAMHKIETVLENPALLATVAFEKADVLIDRFVVKRDDEENTKRIADSVQVAFEESDGNCKILQANLPQAEALAFNNRFELDGMHFEEPSQQLFNYNNPHGACPVCEGYGQTLGIDEQKVIPDRNLSVYEGAVACWKGDKHSEWLAHFLKRAHYSDFPVHRSYKHLSPQEREMLWKGTPYFRGIYEFFKELEEQVHKIQNRVMLARYRGKTTCPACNGGRVRKEATYVKIQGYTIVDWVKMPIHELYAAINALSFDPTDAKIANRILLEVSSRLRFMLDVGLGYLKLERLSSSLSGGEAQRINLTRTLGSNLTGAMYLLDEPSVGLHPRDTTRLVSVLKALRDLGNTVIVVEHEEDIIKNADYLVDMGPQAGRFGGEVVFAGNYENIYTEATESLTAKYMSGRLQIPIPAHRRTSPHSLTIKGATQHNLKNIDVIFPLNTLIVVSGVSGSGKTTLVKSILFPALKKELGEPIPALTEGEYEEMTGDFKRITQVEMISQHAIGKSSRSNPVTYVKAYDAIRDLFADQPLAKLNGFKPKHFSFNVEGGRCETCKGDGEIVVEMQFLADVRLTCDDCGGKRFKPEVLDVIYRDKNIAEILDLSVDDAIAFFADNREIAPRLLPLQAVGLGYVKLGQASGTLSGGEAQRVKLASFLGKERGNEHICFIFDEPTTGLHFHDIQKLLIALNALVEKGHTVIVIEHNLEVVKSADWVIDLGPEAGDEGGYLVFAGTPEGLAACDASYTGRFLKDKLALPPTA